MSSVKDQAPNYQLDYYAMSDTAIALEIGRRIEEARLAANIPQQEIIDELGIAPGTYRSAIRGKMRLDVLIGILRLLGKLDNLDALLPKQPYSPMQLLALEGKKRRRARRENPAPGEDESW